MGNAVQAGNKMNPGRQAASHVKVTKLANHYGNFIATADVDGNYDKRGLPDPPVLAFYFTAHNNLIVQLIILRNRSDI
jgi:hypothetical protein